MKNAQAVTPFYAEGEYTFRFERAAGARWLLAGDAAGFIDPIFSSGVMVALRSSARAAQAILRADRCGRALSAGAQRAYTREMKKMTGAFLGMIRMFYDRHAFEVFMARSPFLGLPRSVVNLVGGNTDLPWSLRWRLWAFYAMCRVQRYRALVPRLSFAEAPRRRHTGNRVLGARRARRLFACRPIVSKRLIAPGWFGLGEFVAGCCAARRCCGRSGAAWGYFFAWTHPRNVAVVRKNLALLGRSPRAGPDRGLRGVRPRSGRLLLRRARARCRRPSTSSMSGSASSTCRRRTSPARGRCCSRRT